jgi:hypothetical protein
VSYSLRPSDDGLYIINVAEGDTTRAIAAEGTRALYEMGMELGIRCFLIDLSNSRNVEPLLENARFTREDAPPVMPPDLCFAVLADPADHSHDFHVAFAQTQGINISLFHDRDEAIEHLKKAADRLNRGRDLQPPLP